VKGVDIEYIETEYHFSNPLLDQTMNRTLKTAWQEIIRILIKPYSQMLDPEYYVIDCQNLYEALHFADPEHLVVSEEFQLHRFPIEIDHLEQAEIEFLDDHAILKSTSINEIRLIDYLILSHFPTYHERDSSLQPSIIEDRIPISVLPTSYLRSIKLRIAQDYQTCVSNHCIKDEIEVKQKLLPTEQHINDYILGKFVAMSKDCTSDCQLKQYLQLEINPDWDEILP